MTNKQVWQRFRNQASGELQACCLVASQTWAVKRISALTSRFYKFLCFNLLVLNLLWTGLLVSPSAPQSSDKSEPRFCSIYKCAVGWTVFFNLHKKKKKKQMQQSLSFGCSCNSSLVSSHHLLIVKHWLDWLSARNVSAQSCFFK